MIATFNWDPFLYQAFVRNSEFAPSPHMAYLHGSVSLGFSKIDMNSGPSGMYSKATGGYFYPTKLLFPIRRKNYNQDDFMQIEWTRVKHWLNLKSTKRLTIYGYGAPETDVEAISLLRQAWGGSEVRDIEQFEIIDVRPEDDVRNQWSSFIHSHHYDYTQDYFESSLARNPRRTSESFFQHYQANSPAEMFGKSNPVPTGFKTLEELWDWHRPLIEAEEEFEKNNSTT